MTKNPTELADYIKALNINGLSGRVLLAPSTTTKNREILVVYDQHASLERYESLVRELQRYGKVTMPDLPGFGGMSSFYKIDQQPTIDNLASYLAAFIKLRYKRKSITVVGIGFGFVVVTRMLQRYPDLTKKVKLLIAIDSLAHHADRQPSGARRRLRIANKRLAATRPISFFYRNIMLYPAVLRARSGETLPLGAQRHKLPATDADSRKNALRTNTQLWRRNNVRSFMSTSQELLKLDNCQQTVDVPLTHIISGADLGHDDFRTEQHLSVIYSKVVTLPSQIENYALIGIVPVTKTSDLLPRKVRSQLLRPQ